MASTASTDTENTDDTAMPAMAKRVSALGMSHDRARLTVQSPHRATATPESCARSGGSSSDSNKADRMLGSSPAATSRLNSGPRPSQRPSRISQRRSMACTSPYSSALKVSPSSTAPCRGKSGWPSASTNMARLSPVSSPISVSAATT